MQYRYFTGLLGFSVGLLVAQAASAQQYYYPPATSAPAPVVQPYASAQAPVAQPYPTAPAPQAVAPVPSPSPQGYASALGYQTAQNTNPMVMQDTASRPGDVPRRDPRKVERLMFGIGIYNIDELNGWPYDTIIGLRNEAAMQFGLEYRAPEMVYGLAPMFGASVTSDAAVYGYGGFGWNVHMGPTWTLMPNFAVGLFSDGHGQSLGGPIEFRSGIELNARVGEVSTLGLAFSHRSNAGIYEHNPGEESLMLNYAWPINLFK